MTVCLVSIWSHTRTQIHACTQRTQAHKSAHGALPRFTYPSNDSVALVLSKSRNPKSAQIRSGARFNARIRYKKDLRVLHARRPQNKETVRTKPTLHCGHLPLVINTDAPVVKAEATFVQSDRSRTAPVYPRPRFLTCTSFALLYWATIC